MDSLDKVGDARSLAQIVVETVHEPLLVLDEDSKILAVSGSFHDAFKITPEQTLHCQLFGLDGGAWDIPALRQLLARALAESGIMEDFTLSHDFPRVGVRTLLLHVRKVGVKQNARATILLGLEDITERRVIEQEKDRLQKQTSELLAKERILLEEMQHRIVNSLQIIASILMMKARAVTSQETRGHLEDAHRRVLSVAEVQKYLHTGTGGDKVDLAPYLKNLCASLAGSMIGETSATKLQVACDGGTVISSEAVSIGLIVTELVINALKYAFPGKKDGATVTVSYAVNGSHWKLVVADNGVGKTSIAPPKGGLGTSLVAALANQLGAEVRMASSPDGLTVSITHGNIRAAQKQGAVSATAPV